MKLSHAINEKLILLMNPNERGNTFHLMLWLHPRKSQTKAEIDTADDRLEGKNSAINRQELYLLIVANLA